MTIYGRSTARVLASVNVSEAVLLDAISTDVSMLGDGLRHFAYQKERKFYNGVTLEEIHSESTVNGIQGR